MGNCLEGSTENAKCTGCGFKKCDCTDGNWSSTYCRRCDRSWKYQNPGYYDSLYQHWLRNNPEPVPPAVYRRLDNFPNILCQACTQCIEFSDITANTVTAGSISQAQNCLANMKTAYQKEQDAKAAADAEEQRKKEEAERLAREAAIKAAEEAAFKKKMMITVLLVLFFAVVIYIIYAYSDDSTTGAAEVMSFLQMN
jgi:hypothetical protein